MKALHSLFCAAALVVPASIQAQEAAKSKDYQCKMKLEVGSQKTPDLTANGVKPKKFVQKDWIELEVAMKFEASNELAKKPEGKVIPSVQVKYYLNLTQANNKRIVLTGDVTYSDVTVGEEVYGIVFLHPDTIKKITGNNLLNPSSISFFAAEAIVGGSSAGTWSNKGEVKTERDKFWTTDGVESSAGLLPKSKTPFAPFWAGRHLQEAAQ